MTEGNSVNINEGKARKACWWLRFAMFVGARTSSLANGAGQALDHAAMGLERAHFSSQGLVAGHAMGDHNRRVTGAKGHFAPCPTGRLAARKELEGAKVKLDRPQLRRRAEAEVRRQVLVSGDIPEVFYFQFDTGNDRLGSDPNQSSSPGQRQELKHDAKRNRANEGCDQHVVHRGTVWRFRPQGTIDLPYWMWKTRILEAGTFLRKIGETALIGVK